MDRRHFLRGMSLALCLPRLAHADETGDAYRAGLPAHPRLAALENCVDQRLQAVARIEGRWPVDLQGIFYRNGPARFELGGERYHHWFDGDGMVQAWHMDGLRVRHEACFERTQKYVDESAAGQFLYPAFDTDFARRPAGNNDAINTANTNVLPHAGKLYALWEGGSATELDPATLATQGIKTWRDDLPAMPFSAHPKVTPDGVLWNFGVAAGADKLLLWRIERDGSLGKFGMVTVPRLPMVHDCVITARYMVFLVPPFDLHNGPHTPYMQMHVWNGKRPLRAVVVERNDFTLRCIIELPAAMLFHLGNGWDEGNTLRFDACITADDSSLRAIEGAMRGQVVPEARTNSVMITLDLARGSARSETLLCNTEFPRVAAADVGRRYRQLFVTSCHGTPQFGMSGVASIDVESGHVERFEYGAGWVVEEHIPVPKARGRGQWLLGVARDVRRQQTVLAVFDGAHLSHGPVAQARLPYAAPLCFHGNFLAA